VTRLQATLAALALAVAAIGATSCSPLCAQDDASQQAPAPQNPFRPFDRKAYEAHARSLGANDAQMAQFAQQAEELGVPRAADSLMRAVRPEFGKAVELSEAGDPKAALALAQCIASDRDAVVGAHVRYHMARVFLDGDDPERAVEILNEYLAQNINCSPLDGEAAFFYAQALADVPLPDLALPRLKAFLQWFPDASERFRATAQQRIAEIERQQESRLHNLADRMKKVGRDLKKQKTNDPIQVEQKEMTEELQQLIEMYEERERQSSGPPNGNGPSSNPANQSQLTEGEGRIGNLEKRVSLNDRWGDMKDKDRKEIESAVQNNLPPQYRKLLEEYYKKLGTGGANK
jgi:tetratricopeptide (TPR) repeat protein